MRSDDLDITGMMTWEEGIPRPQWEAIEAWIESTFETSQLSQAWTDAVKKWLSLLAASLPPTYTVAESDSFLVLAPDPDLAECLLWFAARCHSRIVEILGSLANFYTRGKHLILDFEDAATFTRYAFLDDPEGTAQDITGVHLSAGYPHVAMYGKALWVVEQTLAHELTHAALLGVPFPLWLEEGFAQVVAHDLTNRGQSELNTSTVAKHRTYWSKKGLCGFWSGTAFSGTDEGPGLSYQLAEILVRLLIEDARPRWFGWVREPQQRFFLFLQEVKDTDCGEEACSECLGFTLSALAARFLGEGDWSPSL